MQSINNFTRKSFSIWKLNQRVKAPSICSDVARNIFTLISSVHYQRLEDKEGPYINKNKDRRQMLIGTLSAKTTRAIWRRRRYWQCLKSNKLEDVYIRIMSMSEPQYTSISRSLILKTHFSFVVQCNRAYVVKVRKYDAYLIHRLNFTCKLCRKMYAKL